MSDPRPVDLTSFSRDSRSEFLNIRGVRYHVRHWGEEGAPVLFMLHGWMDTSATFQFMVDALQDEWHVIAPDWRGYGHTEFLFRPYWFPEYYADLEALLAHYSPEVPANLVGHSMGGAIAGIYASVRPHRVKSLAILDFLGLHSGQSAEAPDKIDQWLSEVSIPPSCHRVRPYRDIEALSRRLMSVNPRLSESRAGYLALHTSRKTESGHVELACDPWHKIPSPFPYHADDVMACWRKIVAPVLLLIAEEGFVQERFGSDQPEMDRRLGCFSDLVTKNIAHAGHNLQHDQPEAVAAALEAFFNGSTRGGAKE